MDILVNVVNQKLKIATNQKMFVEGTQKFIRFIFNLPVEWKDLIVFAQFSQNGSGYNDFLDENYSVYLPPEIQTGKCYLTIYGTRGDVVAISDSLEITVTRPNFVRDGQSTEISQSLYTQLVNKVEDYHTWVEL